MSKKACALSTGTRLGPRKRIQRFVFVALFCFVSQLAAAEQRRRIFFLESLSPELPAATRTIAAFKKRLGERTTESFDIFVDYMELVRLPGEAHIDKTVQYLSGKYAEVHPDVLLTLGRAGVSFITKYHDVIAPAVPAILTSVPSTDVRVDDRHDFFWVSTEYDYSNTLDLAQHLQPNARDIVVVGGASDYDKQWVAIARRDLEPYSDRYNIKYISGASYDETLEQVSRLAKDTIVMMSFFFADGSGHAHVSPEVAANVAKVSPAPVYSPISTNLGTGIVGGYMDSWEEEGAAAADVALELLSGKPHAMIHRLNTPQHAFRVDERQLNRWNLSSSRLPPGTDIQFHQLDLWEQYRWQITGVLVVLLAQAAVITGLFLERRRRRSAELELRQRLLEVIHLNRTAVASALSGSVAHELTQPLAAIQSYADAAMLYLKADPPDLAKVGQILGKILQDDQRASGIITHLRRLMKKRDAVDLEEFDLNDVIEETMQIVGPEALKNGVQLVAYNSNGALPVCGDRIQLQQVIMNLTMNGIDAMGSGQGKLSIKTALIDESSVEVSIQDSGVGIPPDELNKIFDAYYTTKSHGTGLGLPIARTIVETYGGKIWAENNFGGGAIFRFTLPISNGGPA